MRKKILGLIAIFAALFMTIGVVKADEYFNANENVKDSESYSHSHFEAGNIVTSNSNVNGLSFVAGSNIEVSGTKEYGFFAGETVKINGIIEKDLFAAGNTVTISKDSSIGRDLYLAGNSVSVESNITGAVFIAASMVKLDNIVIDGDVTITANTIDIGGNVKVTGRLKVNEDVIINNEDNIEVNRKEKYSGSSVNIDFTNKISDIVLDILKTLFTGLILVLIFPNLFKKFKYELEAKDIGMKLLYGLLLLVAVPMICIVSLMIIVGLSISVMLLFMYIIAIMLATIFASAVIGQNIYTKLFKQKDNPYISILVGILIVKLVQLIPVVGGLVSILVFLYGLGMIWQLFLDRNK